MLRVRIWVLYLPYEACVASHPQKAIEIIKKKLKLNSLYSNSSEEEESWYGDGV